MKYIFFVIMMLVALPMSAQKVYTLNECRNLALQNNVKIRNQRLSIDQAKTTEQEAFTKNFPTVQAGGTYFRSSNDIIKKDIEIPEGTMQQLSGAVANLGLNPSALSGITSLIPASISMFDRGLLLNAIVMEPIYAGGQIHNGNRLAKLNSEIQNLILRQTEDEIIQTTEGYYYQLMKLYENQKTLSAAQAQLANIEKDAATAVRAGVKLEADLLTVRLKRDELSSDSLKLDNGIKLVKMVMAQYIGIGNADFDIDYDSIEKGNHNVQRILPATEYIVDFPTALASRTEAALLDKSVEASKLQRKMKQGAMLPTLAVGAAGVYHDIHDINAHASLVGLATVSIPISAWWSDSKSVKKARLAERQAQQEREDNRQKLIIQMQSCYNDLDQAYKQVLIAIQSVKTSDENLRLNQNYYKAGSCTMNDLLAAQTTNRQSLTSLAEAKADYFLARTKYLKAIGQ